MSTSLSCISTLKDVTVEPATFFYILSYVMIESINTNLVLEKACDVNATVERNLDIPCRDERAGTLSSSKVNEKYRPVMFFFCIIYTILATCWSDEAGRRRRPLIFLPIVGSIFQSISGCFHSYFWFWSPDSAAISDAICEGLSGGITLMQIATQMYICDISAMKNRTMQLGILLTVKMVSLTSGAGIAGFLIHGIGFFKSYVVCFVLSIISLTLALIYVEDVSVRVEKKRHFLQLFNLRGRIVDSFKLVFNKTLGRRRILAFILIIIYIFTTFVTQGEKSTFYIFLRRKFHWNAKDHSAYQIYKHVGVIIGTMFCSVVLSKRLKIHDGLIGAFAAFWDSITVFGYLLASQESHLYIIPIFDVFHGTAISICISYLSKLYHSSEYGRLNAVLNVFMLLVPSCRVVYNKVFQHTNDFFPSAIFIISIVINTATSLLYYLSYVMGKELSIGNE